MSKLVVLITTILAIAQICNAKVISLTPANFESMTAGKTVFLKFFAPWCGHCKSMAADFEKLAADWEGHKVGLVAEIDCTDEDGGALLCEEYKVQGFPTLMYGDPSSPEPYEGGRDYESMSEFAKENISKPICSVNNIDFCSDAEKAIIVELQKKPAEELEEIVDDVDKKLKEGEDAFEKQLEELNDLYEKMQADMKEKADEIRKTSNYSVVKQVLAKMTSGKKSSDDEL